MRILPNEEEYKHGLDRSWHGNMAYKGDLEMQGAQTKTVSTNQWVGDEAVLPKVLDREPYSPYTDLVAQVANDKVSKSTLTSQSTSCTSNGTPLPGKPVAQVEC